MIFLKVIILIVGLAIIFMFKQTQQNVIEPIYNFYHNLDKNTKDNLTKSIYAQEIYTGLIDFLVDCGFIFLFYQLGSDDLELKLTMI